MKKEIITRGKHTEHQKRRDRDAVGFFKNHQNCYQIQIK